MGLGATSFLAMPEEAAALGPLPATAPAAGSGRCPGSRAGARWRAAGAWLWSSPAWRQVDWQRGLELLPFAFRV